jgi:sulfur relay (sulfurtransferase) complex TusBCD TusD component (DsrE family)
MSLPGKKLALLVSCGPEHPGFRHSLRLAQTALASGVQVYLYCLDDAVRALADPLLQDLRRGGLNLFACAYGAQRRGIPVSELAVFAGLSTVTDLIAGSDRFLSFSP